MPQSISRLYSSRETSTKVVHELIVYGFPEDAILVVMLPETPVAMADDGIEASLIKHEVPRSQAKPLAEGVRRGETLVSVRPRFGRASVATTVMEKFDPVHTGIPESDYVAPPHDPDAPFSSHWGWKVLLDDATPLSSYLRMPVLSTKAPSARLMDNAAPLSKGTGLPILSDNPAPLSKKAKWRVLWDRATPLSTRARWPVLLDRAAPLSAKAGFSVLSDNPAPLSSKLGLPTLSSNPAPLSTLLGWRVLSEEPKR